MKNAFGDEVVEEGNVVPFPEQAQAKQTQKNEFGDAVVDDGGNGIKLITGRQTPSAKAAQAINLSLETGLPAPLVGLDPDKHQADLDLYWGTRTSEENPAIKGYIGNVPYASSVSQGDWQKLDASSKALVKIGEQQTLLPTILDMMKIGGVKPEVLPSGRLPEGWEMATTREGRSNALKALEWIPAGILLGMLDWASKPGRVTRGEELTQEEEIEFGIGGALMKGPVVRYGAKLTPPGGRSSPEAIRGFMTRAEIDAFLRGKEKGEVPPQMLIEHAKASAEGLKDAIVKANETGTKEVSPTAYEQFTAQHGDLGTVHIPAQTLVELYRSEKKMPMKGDGLFGWVPGLAEKMELGGSAGTEIAIPLGKYVANIDPALHEKIADVVRVHQEGVTLEEVEGIKEAEKAKAEQPVEELETITAAAIQMKSGELVQGTSHFEAMETARQKLGKSSVIDDIVTTDEGMGLFVTSTGRVVDRIEALNIANKASQLTSQPLVAALTAQNIQLKPPTDATPISKHKVKIINETIDAQGKVRKSLYLDPLFSAGKDVGLTQPEFAGYSKLIDKANEKILQKAVDFAEQEVKRRQTAEWRSNESAVKSEVLAELHERPDLKLDRFLRTGSLRPDGGNRFPGDIPKLNKAEVEAIAGEGALERYTRDKGTADLQLLADQFGFASKEEMVQSLVALLEDRAKLDLQPKEYISEIANEEVAKRMEERYGKLEDNIALEASEIALAAWNVDLLTAEWKILARLAGREPPPGGAPLYLKDMQAWTNEQFGMAEVGQVSYKTFERASAKAGREAEKALLKGTFDEAFAWKQTQMLNFLLAKEAKAFEVEQARNEKLLSKYAGNANLPRVDQNFTDQIHNLMLEYGIKIRRRPENVEYNIQEQGGGKDLGTFISDRIAQGDLLIQPPLPAPGTALEDFKVNQYRDFASLIKNLDQAGKNAKLIEVGEKAEDRYQAIDQISKNLDVLEKMGFDPEKLGVISKLRTAGRYIDSKLLKAETLINWMDLNDPMGAASQAIHRPLIEGQYKVGFMLEKIAKLIRALPNNRAWGKALNERVDAGNHPLLDYETREPLKLTNEQKISISLNYGNAGNRRVMLLGHHWTEAEVEAFLSKTMSKMDWAVVKGIHGLFEPLAPHVEEVTRKRSGLAVPLVEKTPYLESEGGYYPLLQDPRDILLKAKQSTDLFDKVKFDPLPMAPALKQRTGSVYKLDFSLNRLHSVIGQTTHAVFMQEPVINANKIIKDPIIREGMAKAFGPEYVRMVDDWIKDIANNGGQNDDMWASWISRNLRENVVTALMGWKVSTALIHGGSAAGASVYEVGKMHLSEKGPKAFALAPLELAKNIRELGLGQFLPNEAKRFFSSDTKMWETIDEVMAESQELPNRIRTNQKDFGLQLEKVFNKNFADDLMVLRAHHNSYAMAMVSFLDLLSAVPVYKSAKAKALVEGHSESDAIFLADKAVREAHGSASLVSRANIGRGELNKWLTIAYNGYWNHNYNKFRQVGFEALSQERYQQQKAAEPGELQSLSPEEEAFHEQFTAGQRVALVGAWITAMLVVGAVVHHAVRGEQADTDEGAVLGSLASQLGGMIPVVNSMMFAVLHNRDPSISPIEEALKAPVRVFRDLLSEEPKHPVKNLAKLSGAAFGFPTNQMIDLMNALNEVSEGEQNPETVGDWSRLIIRGQAEPKEKR